MITMIRLKVALSLFGRFATAIKIGGTLIIDGAFSKADVGSIN